MGFTAVEDYTTEYILYASAGDRIMFFQVKESESVREKKIIKRKGFTLIELLVVISIIAMLAALVGPRLFPKLGKGKQAAAKAQIELLGQALDQFRLDVGRYPTTEEGLKCLVSNPGIENWDGSYLKKGLPSDPWGKSFFYQCPGSHAEYDLFSYGRDGTQGGEGEDKDITSWE